MLVSLSNLVMTYYPLQCSPFRGNHGSRICDPMTSTKTIDDRRLVLSAAGIEMMPVRFLKTKETSALLHYLNSIIYHAKISYCEQRRLRLGPRNFTGNCAYAGLESEGTLLWITVLLSRIHLMISGPVLLLL